MKLCRFSVADDPRPRAGIFHDGKVYETDGEQALGVHAPEAVSLLTPIGHAASLRLFSWEGSGFVYGNPGSIMAPDSSVLFSSFDEAVCSVYLAAILSGSDRDCSVSEVESLLLGYSILLGFSDGVHLHGPGCVLGPFVVTPEDGPTFSALRMRLRLGEEVVSSVDGSLPVSFGEMIQFASRGCDVREGDVFAVGPVPGLSLPRDLRDGDSVIAVVEKLGALGAVVRE